MMWLPSTIELGTVMSTFLMVRMRVTRRLFSTTSPSVSAIFTRSPTRKGRM